MLAGIQGVNSPGASSKPVVVSVVPFTFVTPAIPIYTFPAFEATALNITNLAVTVGNIAADAEPATSPVAMPELDYSV